MIMRNLPWHYYAISTSPWIENHQVELVLDQTVRCVFRRSLVEADLGS